MTQESDIHTELAGFQDEVIALLDSGDFFDIDGPYDPVEVYASIPKKAKEEYIAASKEKNSRVWDIVKALIVGQAITAGISAFKTDYENKIIDKIAWETRKKSQSPKSYMDDYVKEHGGKFITNMGRTDQQALVKFIWLNAGKHEKVLARDIARQPGLKYALDQGKHRYETIVRTEKFRATEYGTFRTSKDNGFKTKERVTAGDKRVRPSHQALGGIVVAIDDPFPNGEMFPGENSINCRCRVRYGFDVSKIDKNAAKTYAANQKAIIDDARRARAEAKSAPKQPVTIQKGKTAIGEKLQPRKVAPKAEVTKVAKEKPVVKEVAPKAEPVIEKITPPKFMALPEHQAVLSKTFENFNTMHPELRRNVKEVIIMRDHWKGDAELSKKFGQKVNTLAAWDEEHKRMLGFPNANGKVEPIKPGVMAHELAHSIDAGLSDKAAWKAKARADGKFATKYAADSHRLDNSYKEDFAESIRLYTENKDQFKEKFPNRHEYLERVVFSGKHREMQEKKNG